MVPSGGELWATDAGMRDDVTAQWEQILSATFLPWTVAIPELPERNAFRAWVRRSNDASRAADVARSSDNTSHGHLCVSMRRTRRLRHQPADGNGSRHVAMQDM